MDYTHSDAYSTHPGTGHRMHQATLPVTTEVSPADMNQIIWSLMDVLNAAGVAGAPFDPAVPGTYDRLTTAIRALITRVSVPVVPEATASIQGRDLNNLGLPSGLYTYAHSAAANSNHPAGFAGNGLFLFVQGAAFELQALWAKTDGLVFRVRHVSDQWSAVAWQEVATTRSLVEPFSVGGLSSRFYPVMIGPRARTSDLPINAQGIGVYEFEVFRADTHDGGEFLGTFSLKVGCIPGRWGHYTPRVLWTDYQRGNGNQGIYINPVADVRVSFYSDCAIVWLRGGANYALRSMTEGIPVRVRVGNAGGGVVADPANPSVTFNWVSAQLVPVGCTAYHSETFNGGGIEALFGAPGWRRFDNGLILQWGSIASVPAGGSVPITFPAAFPNFRLSMTAVPTLGGVVPGSVGISTDAATGGGPFRSGSYVINNGSIATGVSWLALGY